MVSPDAAVPFPVLVCDSDEMMVRLLAADLRRQEHFQVTECPANSSKIVSSIARTSPAVFVLGLRTHESSGDAIQLLRRVHHQFPRVRSIVISEDTGEELIVEIFRAGVKGFYRRSEYDPAMFARCIQRVAEGQIWARNNQIGMVISAFASSPVATEPKGLQSLTPRESEVARAVSEGLSNLEVAQRLGISIHTVKNHIFSVFEKIGVSNRAELILYFVTHKNSGDGHGSRSTHASPAVPQPAGRLRRSAAQESTPSNEDLKRDSVDMCGSTR
jgi:DNA-binding NarL/FixJ family response regulator